MSLQNLRQFLEQYHFGIGSLLWIGFLCCLSAILAFREFLSWYLKVNQLSQSLQSLHERIDRLEDLVSQSTVRQSLGPVAPPSSDAFPVNLESDSTLPSLLMETRAPVAKSNFPIHH